MLLFHHTSKAHYGNWIRRRIIGRIGMIAVRVVRQGGSFSFQDMFLDQSLYGEVSDLVGMVHHWGVREVHVIPTKDVMAIPLLVRNRRALGYAGLLYGRK